MEFPITIEDSYDDKLIAGGEMVNRIKQRSINSERTCIGRVEVNLNAVNIA